MAGEEPSETEGNENVVSSVEWGRAGGAKLMPFSWDLSQAANIRSWRLKKKKKSSPQPVRFLFVTKIKNYACIVHQLD